MMFRYTIVDENNEVVKTIETADKEILSVNTPVGGKYFEGISSLSSYWSEKDRIFVERPSLPSVFHKWNVYSKTWIDPRTLDDLRAEAWTRIKQARDAVEFSPFDYAGNTFDGDATAQRRLGPLISLSKSAIAAGQPFSYPWKTVDNQMVELTAQDFVAMELAKVQQFGAAFIRAEALHAQILESTTPEQLEAIQW